MVAYIIAYIGPDTMLPVASVVAAVVGGFMMLGRNALRFVLGSIRALIPGREPRSRPHVRPSAGATEPGARTAADPD